MACDPDFIVVGYGKLGGIELGHGSDLDLVFIHDADPTLATDGAHPHRQRHVLHAPRAAHDSHPDRANARSARCTKWTCACVRRDAAGLLVSPRSRSFANYQNYQAWTWEHQALVRARVVAGDRQLADAFEELRHEVLAKPREPANCAVTCIEMREKMRDQLLTARYQRRKQVRVSTLKHGVGGIVDIEFMVQYCVLAWSGDAGGLERLHGQHPHSRGTERERPDGVIRRAGARPRPTRPIAPWFIDSPFSGRTTSCPRANTRRCATRSCGCGMRCWAVDRPGETTHEFRRS